jgi:TonB family protein
MNRLRPAAWLLLLLAGSAAAAPLGGAALQQMQCASEHDRSVAPEKKIAACTALIDAEDLYPAELALTYTRRGDGYVHTGKFDLAIADYDTALARYGVDDPNGRRKLVLDARGYAYMNQSRYARALADFDAALRLDPDYAAGYAGRGGAYANLGLGARALQDLDHALSFQEDSVMALLGRGMVDQRTGETPRALAELDFVVHAGFADPIAYYYRGQAHFDAGQYDLALQDLDKAIALAPGAAPPRVARERARIARDAVAARLVAKVPDAPLETQLENTAPSRALGRSHDCATMYPSMSRRLLESGDVKLSYDVDAAGTVGNVVLVTPSGSNRLDRAAVACVSSQWRNAPARQDGAPVASSGHQAIVIFHAPPPIQAGQYTVRGSAYADLGDYEHAMADLDYAVQLDPKEAWSFYNRGLVELAMGRLARAKADLETALTLRPDFPNAADARDFVASELGADAKPSP